MYYGKKVLVLWEKGLAINEAGIAMSKQLLSNVVRDVAQLPDDNVLGLVYLSITADGTMSNVSSSTGTLIPVFTGQMRSS